MKLIYIIFEALQSSTKVVIKKIRFKIFTFYTSFLCTYNY